MRVVTEAHRHVTVATAAGLLTLFVAVAPPSTLATPVQLQNATATFSQCQHFLLGDCYGIAETIDGIISVGISNDGWAVQTSTGATTPQTAVWETAADVSPGSGGGTLTFTMHYLYGAGHEIGHLSLGVTTDSRANFADGVQGREGIEGPGQIGSMWTQLSLTCAMFSSVNGSICSAPGDGSLQMIGSPPSTDVYTVSVPVELSNITGFRLDAIGNPPGLAGNGNFVLNEFQVDAAGSVPEPGSLLLLASGLVVAGATGWRRRQSGPPVAG